MVLYMKELHKEIIEIFEEISNDTVINLESLDLMNNYVIEGDNIYSLLAMVRQSVKFDLIYIDPPYNTKKTNIFKYNDNNDDWLSFIYNRLVYSKELLSDTGSIFISIGDHEYARLKYVCDLIFGSKNFVANFIWKKSHTVKNDKNGISTQHEYILCYAKNIQHVKFNREKTGEDYIKRAYCHTDSRGTYRLVPLHKEKNPNEYTVFSPTGIEWTKKWNYNRVGFNQLILDDMVYWGKDGKSCPSKKVYLKEDMNKSFGTILDPAKVGYTGWGAKSLAALGFDKMNFIYAKPVELIQHILEIASTSDSKILDFFAGSGTTAEAVMRLNLKDGGSRRFVMCNNNENEICEKVTYPRVEKAKEKYESTIALKYCKIH